MQRGLIAIFVEEKWWGGRDGKRSDAIPSLGDRPVRLRQRTRRLRVWTRDCSLSHDDEPMIRVCFFASPRSLDAASRVPITCLTSTYKYSRHPILSKFFLVKKMPTKLPSFTYSPARSFRLTTGLWRCHYTYIISSSSRRSRLLFSGLGYRLPPAEEEGVTLSGVMTVQSK